MALRLSDKWVWDSWIADTGREFHLFYLQAPRSLGDQLERHWHATVGHACRKVERLLAQQDPTTVDRYARVLRRLIRRDQQGARR